MIHFFDHDRKPWEFLSSYDGVERLDLGSFKKDLGENDIVFLHLQGPDILKWYKGIISGEFKGHLVLLRSLGKGTPIDDEDIKKSGRVHICSLTPQQFKTKAVQIFQDIQSGKWEILNPNHQIDTLISLCILSQGYLAAHSDPKGKPEGINDSEKIIEQALGKMRWPEFCQANTSFRLAPHMSDDKEIGLQNRKKLREEVRSTVFWAPLVEPNKEGSLSPIHAIDEIKQKEWDALQTDGDWMPVESLFKTIKEKKTPGHNAGLVARSFIQLASKLGDNHD